MDPTKLPGALEWCSKRNCVLGGDTLSGKAKVPVPDGKKASEFIAEMGKIVPSDQINVLAMSPQVPGFPIVEVAAWPERHSRSKLPPEQVALLGPATTAVAVFQQANRALTAIDKQGGRIASFGCDGGVHGMGVIDSLHNTRGPKLDFVAERTEEEIYKQLLVGQFSKLKLVSCKTTRGHVIAGVLDPDHILKRNEEQVCCAPSCMHTHVRDCHLPAP
eukprot:3003061-Prymnesium_polylepis.1